jgi:hypothetical protein
MNFKHTIRIFLATWPLQHMALAQADLSYYLPTDIDYNNAVPTPASFLGHEVGEWHITHDKLVYYFYELAGKSDRVIVEKIGETYEHRPLLNVIITSEKNHKRLEEMRIQHVNLTNPAISRDLNVESMPVVVRLGYSIHGNEASGANASTVVAYHLAAGMGDEMEELLDKCIILIDPCLNPDGLQRHSTWVNEHRSKTLNPDTNGREFREAWPGGRTNHYWFDLNRDWLLAQHPESIARLRVFHRWKPNIQTDHHEMGSDATFFFQPGVPSRKNALIPEENVVLTEKIAHFHAAALNEHKRLYYTKESYDDYYFGKGSTYPDIHGGVGILFEQAAVRGHLRETENGVIAFPFAIKNQVITSLSTLKASMELKNELLEFQKQFFIDVSAKQPDNSALVIGTAEDPARAMLMAQVLLRHKIEIFGSDQDIQVNGKTFYADRSFLIPLNQNQKTLISAIFNRVTNFQDSLFYDISAWNFDLSYNTDLERTDDRSIIAKFSEKMTEASLPQGAIIGEGSYAYVINWNQYYAPGFLYALQQKGILAKVAHEPFTTSEGLSFDRGTILIPVGLQTLTEEDLHGWIMQYALKYHIKVHALTSGLSAAGVDLGSNNASSLQKPVIAMLIGSSVRSYEAGEAWHLLDQRYGMHQTMIAIEDVGNVKLDRYNVLLLPGGSYSSLDAAAQERIRNWVKNGGTLVAWSGAMRLLQKLKIADFKLRPTARIDSIQHSYADRPRAIGAHVIGGAILNAELDTTHPLAYGYRQKGLPVFKRGTLVLNDTKGSHLSPIRYTPEPLISGYVSKENLARISGSPAVVVSSFGGGKVIGLVDNPNFRAFWYGTNRILMNAIFWGDQISTR